jgi:glycosyltransferase involved in cell wall biosynthesis
MRVLLLHSRPLDFKQAVGGVPEFLKAITGELKKLDLEVMIYAGHKSFKQIAQTDDVHENVKVFSGPLIEPAFWVSRHKLHPIIEFCQQQNISVLHSQGTYTPGFMVREIAKVTGIPYVVTSHSDIHPVNSMRLKRRSVRARYRRILQDAACVTHLTPVMEAASHQILDTRDKSYLIHNGIDVASWKPYQHLSEKNYVLGIGRLERGKGFHVLIDMFAEVLKRGVNTSLVIAGTGEAEPALRKQCRDLQLNVVEGLADIDALPEKSVIFAGYVRGEFKYQLIAHSQCLLFATQPDLWEEAFGLVQLEAMAAGKPLIASDIAAVRYMESLGMRAIVVPARDTSAWADAVQWLQDPAQRLVMGTANVAAIAAFDWRDIAAQYREVYRKAALGLAPSF